MPKDKDMHNITLDEAIVNLKGWLRTAIEDSFGPSEIETFRVAIQACELMRNGSAGTPVADDIYTPDAGADMKDEPKMTKLEKAKEIIKEHFKSAECGIYNTRSIAGDVMDNIYDENGLTIDICYTWEYFEVFGLRPEDFYKLKKFYNRLVWQSAGGILMRSDE